jgi:hypothetical protein
MIYFHTKAYEGLDTMVHQLLSEEENVAFMLLCMVNKRSCLFFKDLLQEVLKAVRMLITVWIYAGCIKKRKGLRL